MICFYIDGLAGGYRALSIAKYLGKAGHDVDLICFAKNNFIHKSSFGRIIGVSIPSSNKRNNPSIKNRLINRILYWPDPERRWVTPVIKWLNESVYNINKDAIIVSSPPHSIQLIGILLSRKYKIPYIADLRDDWLTNNRTRWYTLFHKYISSYYERIMVESSALIMLNTNIVEERYRKRYLEYSHKFITVTNGYDEEDFNSPFNIDLKHDIRKIIVYTGSMYGNFIYERLSELVQAIKLLGLNEKWRIVTAGSELKLLKEQKDVWTHLGLLRPESAAALMSQAHILIAFMPPGEKAPSGTVPLKIYSYLRSGKPIIYFGEKGSTTDIISKYQGTYIKERTEWPCLAEWLREVDLPALCNRKGIDKYSFKNIATEVENHINKIVNH